jgi:hypothetical protein
MANLNDLPSLTSKPEPAMYVQLLLAMLTLAVSFGLHLSETQVGAITSVAILVGGLVIRHHVSPAVPAS